MVELAFVLWPYSLYKHPPMTSGKGNGRTPVEAPWRGWILLVALVLAVLAAYHPAWHGGMLWDDAKHITAAELRSVEGLGQIWLQPGATQQYYPMAHSAFWLQHRLWGDTTTGYHLVNIVLHGLSAFLVTVILRRLRVPGAVLAGVIFALHPVHVESVAWITELKNTLSAVFYLSAGLVYLRFDARREAAPFLLALTLFVAALLTKTVTATLPVALLGALWWQRGSLGWRRDFLPLTPFLALGAAAGLFTAWVERTMIGARGPEFQFSIVERTLVAGRAIWFYLAKLVWPADLAFSYPRWRLDAGEWWQYLFPAGVAVLLAVLWRLRVRTRAPLSAGAIYIATLGPVLGFLNVYPFRYSFVADHFQYLASIPIIALGAGGLTVLAGRWSRRTGQAAAVLTVGLVLGSLTWAQSREYRDAETLYQATLRRNPESWLAHINLGVLKVGARSGEAAAHFAAALTIKPDLPEGHYNLGLVAHRDGRLEEAMARYREAVRVSPADDRAEIHNNLGEVLRRRGRVDEALREGDLAVRQKPSLPEAHFNLALALDCAGRSREAIPHHQEALRLGGEAAEVRYELANALQRSGRLQEAVVEYEAALALRPDFAEAHNNLGSALQQLGRTAEAMERFESAVRLKPDYADARYYLGNVLLEMGRLDEAVIEYREALRRAPGDAALRNNLGLALESLGRLEEAEAEYREALRLRPGLSQAQDSLARVRRRLN